MLDVAAPPPSTAPLPVAPPAPTEHHGSFREALSALNPLQYLPVIGTIYRAVTGDQIAEPLRRLGSLVVSFLIAGPIGAAINIATVAAEKITGIDLDRTGQTLLTGKTTTTHPPIVDPAPASASAVVARADTPAVPASSSGAAWSPVQLAAYGVDTGRDGSLRLGALSGADVLNSLELSRIKMAQFAYGRAVGLVG